MTSFDFENKVFDERAVIREASRLVPMQLPFILVRRTLKLRGRGRAFCDLILRGCIIDATEKEKLLEEAVNVLLRNEGNLK